MGLNILLLEDDPSKKGRLLALLTGDKSLFAKVDVAISTSAAKQFMTETLYDLFIADVVVPAEIGGEKSEQYCISLFEELDEGHAGIITPRFSLPISSQNGLSQDAHDFFKVRPWGILPYSEINEDCLLAIEKISRFVLLQKDKSIVSPKCDIFILTALMEPEFLAIERLDLQWGPLEPLDSSQLIRFGKIEIADCEYSVGAAFCSRPGPVAASILTVKATLKLQPKIVLMGGICAGFSGKVSLGDVIAAETSWDWQSGKYIDKTGKEAFQIAPHQFCLDDRSRNQILLLKRDNQFWESFDAEAKRKGLSRPALRVGPVASGSSVVSDERVVARIKENQHKNVIGLDMETYSVYASSNACNPSTKVISLKSVCDMGDKKKNDEYQEYASAVSAASIYHFLKNYSSPLLGSEK